MENLFAINSTLKSFYLFMFSICISVSLLVQFDCQTKTIEKQENFRFAITIGSGGGFTGLFEGCNFYSDGMVEFWHRYPAKNDSVYWIYRIDPTKFDTLQNKLIQSDMLNNNINETGNITNIVTYYTPDTTYYWSWNQQSKIPDSFRKWYNEVFQFFERIKKKSDNP
jgi:hypothetical protein